MVAPLKLDNDKLVDLCFKHFKFYGSSYSKILIDEIIKRLKTNKFNNIEISNIKDKLKIDDRINEENSIRLKFEIYDLDDSLKLIEYFTKDNIQIKYWDSTYYLLKFIIKQLENNEPKLNEYRLDIIKILNTIDSKNKDSTVKDLIIMKQIILDNIENNTNGNMIEKLNKSYMVEILENYKKLIMLYNIHSKIVGYDDSALIKGAENFLNTVSSKYLNTETILMGMLDIVDIANKGTSKQFTLYRRKITEISNKIERPNKMLKDVNDLVRCLIILKRSKEKHEIETLRNQ